MVSLGVIGGMLAKNAIQVVIMTTMTALVAKATQADKKRNFEGSAVKDLTVQELRKILTEQGVGA